MAGPVIKRVEEGICYLTLNRPERLNAMDLALLEGLLEGLQGVASEGARVVAIEGSGGAFSAGADLVEFYGAQDVTGLVEEMVEVLNQVVSRIRRLEVPVVALVKGAAVGAGFSLVLACDLAMAQEGSRFNMGYMRIGLSPDGGATLSLCRVLGLKKAMEAFLLTEDIDASKARELGLVNFVFPEGEFDRNAKEILLRLRDLPPQAVAWTKRLVNEALFEGLEAHLERERVGVVGLSATREFRERVEAFLRKG